MAENGGIDRISSLITGALARRGLAGNALSSLAIHRVNAWIAGRFPVPVPPARAERIVDGTLRISCDHSAILQELQLQLPELRAFVARECPFVAVSEIRLARADTAGNALAPGNPPA